MCSVLAGIFNLEANSTTYGPVGTKWGFIVASITGAECCGLVCIFGTPHATPARVM